MNSSQSFSMRFRYPILFIILFGMAFALCSLLAIYMILAEINLTVGLSLAGVALLSLYLIYETSKTILVDNQGIALASFLGETHRFTWQEITGIKPMNFLKPGMKVVNQNGESIEISSLLGRYDVILELIRRTRRDLWDKPQPVINRTNPSASVVYDLEFKKPGWGWIGLPLVFGFALFLFIISLETRNLLYELFGAFMLFGVFPGSVYSFFRNPVLIATRGDILLIRFRSKRLREPIQIQAMDVENVCFNHQRTVTQHGAVHPSTDVAIYLPGRVKITATGFNVSNEEMYLKLAAWMERYVSKAEEEG